MSDPFTSIKEALQAACRDPNQIPGAILAAIDKYGNLLIHESAGVRQAGQSEPMNKNALHWVASCTKLITAIACMQMIEQDKLKLDDPVHTIIPEYCSLEQHTKTKVTLRHLLTHTAGRSYPAFHKGTAKFFEENKITSFGCKMASIKEPTQNWEPGTMWEYGSGIDWAGQMVESVSGLTLDVYFKEFIFEPLGIKNMTMLPESGVDGGVKKTLAGLHSKDKDGIVKSIPHQMELNESQMELQYGGAGIYANAAEYIQIFAALMNDGTHPKTGNTILKPESVKELLQDQLNAEQVNPMYKVIQSAQLDWTNDVTIMEGMDKNWSFAGCKVPISRQFVWWAGICNHYWFMDVENGVAAIIQTQIIPFFDADVTSLFFGQVMPTLLEYSKAQNNTL